MSAIRQVLARVEPECKVYNQWQAIVMERWLPERPLFQRTIRALVDRSSISKEEFKFYADVLKKQNFFEIHGGDTRDVSVNSWEEVARLLPQAFWLLNAHREDDALVGLLESSLKFIPVVMDIFYRKESGQKVWDAGDKQQYKKARLAHILIILFLLKRFIKNDAVSFSFSSRVFRTFLTCTQRTPVWVQRKVFVTLLRSFREKFEKRKEYLPYVDQKEWFQLRLIFIALMEVGTLDTPKDTKTELGKLLGILQNQSYMHRVFSFDIDSQIEEQVKAKEYLAAVGVVLNEIHMWLCGKPATLNIQLKQP
jgi:hypothetical protein